MANNTSVGLLVVSHGARIETTRDQVHDSDARIAPSRGRGLKLKPSTAVIWGEAEPGFHVTGVHAEFVLNLAPTDDRR